MNAFLQILVGFIIADFNVGFFHWFEDTYLDYFTDIPFFKDIAQHNELHHYFPRAMLACSAIENVYTAAPFVIMLGIVLFLVNRRLYTRVPFLIGSILMFTLFGNAAHRVCHYRECESNDFFRILQRVGIICTHEHHRHHHLTSDSKYCIWTPYMNHFLYKINFWKGLETAIFFLT